jgi:PAS domain S-box-containing protein
MLTSIQNILIIDDNPKNIQLAANVLKSNPLFKIYFATSGEDGITQLEKKEYALILLDINMPHMNGYETADIIKSNPKTENIPIIFLSANADHDSINQGFQHGGQDYITKPFQQHELINRVTTHVELFVAKKLLQNEVDESQNLLEQYKDIIDKSTMVSKSYVQGRITYVNDLFCQTSQYTKEELLGSPHSIVRHKNMSQDVFKGMWEKISSKQSWRGILENQAKDGSSYFVDGTIMPILNSHNEIIEYISVHTDITKQMMAQEEILNAQKEILFTLGEMGELRSQETGDHVNRVAHYAELLGQAYGLQEREVDLLKMASPMHDIGKIAISDSILLKPAKLTDEEFTLMKKHATFGYEIFKNSKHEVLCIAATISHEHHEKWDGSGYPRGLKGEEISIYGRITAIADVYDALSHDRVYKEAWPQEDVLSYMKEQSGIAFDPELIELFLNNIDAIDNIRKKHYR